MSIESLPTSNHSLEAPINPDLNPQPQFTLVEGVSPELRDSRALYDGYIKLRNAAKETAKPEGEELREIQEAVRGWLEEHPEYTQDQRYDQYDQERVTEKLEGLNVFLNQHCPHKISGLELFATESFVSSAFEMYEDRTKGKITEDADGSFAFIVPARMGRFHPEYGEEIELVIPSLRYVPNELR
jgi:hypothetical protein